MHIADLTAYIVNLPLKREMKHASFSRRDSANLLVRCRLTDGTLGWGEGVPRSYVTGETPDGAVEILGRTPLAEQLNADVGAWRASREIHVHPAWIVDVDGRGVYRLEPTIRRVRKFADTLARKSLAARVFVLVMIASTAASKST